MNKLVDLIAISEVTEAFELEKEFKRERKNLKPILQSLRALKRKARNACQILQRCNDQLKEGNQENEKQSEKKNQIDYYAKNGGKIFVKLAEGLSKSIEYYGKIRSKAKKLYERIKIFMCSSKLKIELSTQNHEEVIKDYASKCFPETSSFLYMIGLVAIEKIAKVQDVLKQKSMKDETILYIQMIDQLLDQIEEMKQQAIQLGHNYYIKVGSVWKDLSFQLTNQVNSNSIDENQMQQYQGIQNPATDRSGKSSQIKSQTDLEDD